MGAKAIPESNTGCSPAMRFTVPSASNSREYLDTAAALTRTLLACLTTHSHDSTTSSSVCHGWFVLGIGGSRQSPRAAAPHRVPSGSCPTSARLTRRPPPPSPPARPSGMGAADTHNRAVARCARRGEALAPPFLPSRCAGGGAGRRRRRGLHRRPGDCARRSCAAAVVSRGARRGWSSLASAASLGARWPPRARFWGDSGLPGWPWPRARAGDSSWKRKLHSAG